jgi:anti-sigma factor RsiW
VSPDDARERFSEAFEGELDGADREAFDAALATDAELRAEYEDFVETIGLMGRMAEADAESAPDLVAGVQERIRRRSRGRYYRDRFAQRAGASWVLGLLTAMTIALTLAVAWYAVSATVVLEDAAHAPGE